MIFALVFARANVFAQNFNIEKGIYSGSNVYKILLEEGIDSILKAKMLSPSYTLLIKSDSGFSVHNGNGSTKIILLRDSVFHFVFMNTIDGEEGICGVIADGRINGDALKLDGEKFSFARSRKYSIKLENKVPNVNNSFWDSTAKPILVTIGAIAVIALFFLVRG